MLFDFQLIYVNGFINARDICIDVHPFISIITNNVVMLFLAFLSSLIIVLILRHRLYLPFIGHLYPIFIWQRSILYIHMAEVGML